MKQISANITGSFILNGVDVTDLTISSSVWSGSLSTRVSNLESFSGSINSYTASNNTNISNLNATTASLNSYTGSNNTNISNLNATSASLNLASGSAITRLNAIEVVTGSNISRLNSIESTTGSLNTASGSAITRLNALEVTSGSNITRISALESASGSAITRLNSIESTTGSLNAASGSAISRLNSIESTTGSLNAASGSAISRLSALEVTSGSNISRLSSLESKTGSYATTGSNIFVDGQYISQSSNPTGFTTTASLYTDGGLRVSRDAYISGTLYLNNVTVYGTQSVCFITSSQLNISSNIISVNTATPSVRFGGLSVYDSGSTGLTGSILWDSQDNQWIYSNPSGSEYDSAMFLVGPRNTGALGSEVGIGCNFLSKGNGLHHMTSSGIFEDGSRTCFYGNTVIGSSGNICTSTAAFTSCASVGTTVQCNVFTVKGAFSGGYFPSTATKVPLANFVGDNPELLISDYSNAAGRTATLRLGTTDVDYYCYGAYVRAIQGSGVDSYSLAFGTSANNPSTTKLTINGAGVSCFAGTVCSPTVLSSGTVCATGNTCFGGMSVVASCLGIGTATPLRTLHVRGGNGTAQIESTGNNSILYFGDVCSTGIDNRGIGSVGNDLWFMAGGLERMRFTSAGIACFACQVCAPSSIIKGTINEQLVLDFVAGIGSYTHQSFRLCGANQYRLIGNTNGNFVLRNDIVSSDVLTFACTGIATFACQVCSPAAIFAGCVGIGTTTPKGRLHLTGIYDGAQNSLNLENNWPNTHSTSLINFWAYYNSTDPMAVIEAGQDSSATNAGVIMFKTMNAGAAPVTRMRITPTGVSCFQNTVCMPMLLASGCVLIGDTAIPDSAKLVIRGGNNSLRLWSDVTTDQPGMFVVTCNGSGNSNLYAKVYGAGIVATVFGQAIACKAILATEGACSTGLLFGTLNNAPIYVGTNNQNRILLDASGIACFSCIVCAPIHSATTRVLINSTCPCSMLMSIGGYGTTWGGNYCYYGGGISGGGFPFGDEYGNGASYTYQVANTAQTNPSLLGGFSGGYFRGGNGGAYGGGGAGIVAIGGNGANAENVNSGGGAGIFARGGLNGACSARAYAAWFDGGNVVIRCGNLGIGTNSPGAPLHVVGNEYIAKSSGDGTYKQVVVGQTTAASSGVAKKIAYVGFTHSVRIYVWVNQSTAHGSSATADMITLYGSNSTSYNATNFGNVTDTLIAYNNGGSPAYTVDVTLTYSGTAPTINYVIEGISWDNNIYTL